MKKILLLGDMHIGIHASIKTYMDQTREFIKDFIIPLIKKENIDTVIQAGDLLDIRKNITAEAVRHLREDVMEPVLNTGIRWFQVLGNHDVAYRNTNALSLTEEILTPMSGVTVIKEPQTIQDIVFLPWINTENRERSFSEITRTDARICVGHLELSGFEMYRGHPCTDGMDPKQLQKFDAVYSGHFHHRSCRGNIHYLGTPYELCWHDYGDPRGVHILDNDRRSSFLENPVKLHQKVSYTDEGCSLVADLGIDISGLSRKIVKVLVENKTNHYLFDSLIREIEAVEPVSLRIVEDKYKPPQETTEGVVSAESMLDTIKIYIDSMNIPQKEEVLKELVSLYNESTSL